MKRVHVAFLGTEDGALLKRTAVEIEVSAWDSQRSPQLTMVALPGDHSVTLPLAVEEFSMLIGSVR